jgi:RNA polymerase sigma-54 factor
VKQQEKFFLHGIRFLRPLVLRDIAEAVGMHESTISRVTTSKYIATPRGTFEMKYFFTSSIGAGVGDAEFSSKTVMFYIKELIDAEDPKDILSDDAIVKLLRNRNVDVARRTITKYREAQHIPSSVVRRRQKNNRA